MKLQNMAVIFLIIVIPIILLLSYYISLQVDTLNMQAAYNAKLLESAKEAISSFEINTVEWNEAYSETADSKRRDIMASINTFITSFANQMGIGGISKEYILPYIPALAYTLYDGYYIYSPSEVKETVKNSNGVTVFISEDLSKNGNLTGKYRYDKADNGKILYSYNGNDPDGYYNGIPFTLDVNKCDVSTYSHILKPFSSYAARYVKSSTDITVNYTLDNYIAIYGTVNGNYLTKSGYLIDISYVTNMPRGTWKDIKIKKDNNIITIQPETLSENIWYEGLSEPRVYNYVYASDNTKVYFDGNTTFQVNSNGIKINLNTLTSVKYKKLVILNNDYSTTEIYQALTNGSHRELLANGDYKETEIKAGTWYSDMVGNEYSGVIDIDIRADVSAINYYVEAYAFTTWINNNLSKIEVSDMVGDKNGINTTGKIFQNPESENSVFTEHKREVIKQTVISSLNQAITSYSRNSEGTYKLPVLLETDWDQILSNVSIVTFVQNIPIGLKTYNNYGIATSTNNKEYVDPKGIYLNVTNGSDEYYHLPYCQNISGENSLIGYRNIDYTIKFYEINEATKYYYRHSNICQEADYYCLVQRSLYKQTNSVEQTRAYETALARERYVAKTTNIGLAVKAITEPSTPEESITQEVDNTPPVITINTDINERIVNSEIIITITDDKAVTGYQISTNQNPSDWLSVANEKSVIVNFTPDTLQTYYIHAKDAEGNISTEIVSISEVRWKNENKNKYYNTMEEAFSLASNGDKLTLLGSYNDSSKPIVDTNIIVNIGSYTLTKDTNTIEIGNGGTVTLIGTGTITTSAKIVLLTNKGNLYIGATNQEFTGTLRNIGGSAATISNQGGTLVITGGTVENYGGSAGVHTSLTGNTVILGGTVKTDCFALWHVSSGELRIIGDSTIIENNSESSTILVQGDDCVVTIGATNSTNSSYPYIHNSGDGSAIYINGTSGSAKVNIYSGWVYASGNAINLTKGILNVGNIDNRGTIYPKIESENQYAIYRPNFNYVTTYNKYGGTLIGVENI